MKRFGASIQKKAAVHQSTLEPAPFWEVMCVWRFHYTRGVSCLIFIIKLTEQEDESGEIYESNYSIGQIKEFIASHYNDQDINLTSIAQKFGFNACYLSRMFKQKAGICLNNYLSQCRMEKAIALARKGQLMYITAKEVGIPDPNYFSKCFKKYTGKIYSEFLRNHTSEIRP